MAYSWGGYESLIIANQPEQIAAIRPAGGVDFTGTLVRVHIGLESVDDLIADLAAGFAKCVKLPGMDIYADNFRGKVCVCCVRDQGIPDDSGVQ